MPELRVTIGGRPVEGHVFSLRVATRLSCPAQAEVRLAGAAKKPLGDKLIIAADGEELFAGEVTAVELVAGPGPERTTILRAYDALHRLRKRQRPRVFEDVTVAGLAQELTADLGISIGEDGADGRIERLVQHRQTDFELLAQTTARAGIHFVLIGRTLYLGVLGDPVELTFGGNLWQATVESNAERAVGSVTAIGWRPGDGEVLTEKASGGSTGQGDRTLVDQSPDLLGEAARAAVAAGAARALHIRGVAVGEPRLTAGRAITLSGVDDNLEGTFRITEAVHTIDENGYLTEFSTEPPESEPVPTGTGLTIGRVTSVDDPENRGRIEIQLPAFGDVSIGWLAVLCPGAGPGKGVVALPDPGDLTIVALPHENPAEGVVLGSLYGTQTPPGSGKKRWTLHSGAGQVIILDDDRKAITLENADGSKLDLAPDLVSLSANTDMVIEAPGHHLAIRAMNIDFDRALLP